MDTETGPFSILLYIPAVVLLWLISVPDLLLHAGVKIKKHNMKFFIDTANLDQIKDGQYPGEAPFNDMVYSVMVTVKDHRIENIEIVDIGSNEFQKEAEDVAQGVVSDQALPVDAMSGATVASQALLKAVENALHQAADPTE